ncbi:MAG: DNA polymerase Y family protein [Myxococcota bacterium]
MSSTDRAACVDVPALPLQLLLQREPSWTDAPVVVVADDRPQAEVQWVNEPARRARIRPGMSYAAAQSLEAHVRAGVIPPEEIDAAIERVVSRLCDFSPRIEAAQRPTTPQQQVEGAPGVFWVDPSGMIPLFTSFEHWGHGIERALHAIGFRSTVVVGFHRYRCYALSQVRQGGVWVLEDPSQETRAADRVPLDRLAVPARVRAGLDRLDVRTLGRLRRLPAADLRTRFGEAAAHLHACASDGWAPLRPRSLVEPVTASKQIEPPDDDRTRLLFLVKSMLHDAMVELADRSHAMAALHLRLRLDHAEPHEERIEPARATLDEPMVIDLVRLRLDAATLEAPVEEIELTLDGVDAPPGQLALFRTQARRDLDAAGRALARLRAWLGPQAVTRARLRDAHLPEAQFAYEPIVNTRFPRPEVVGTAGKNEPARNGAGSEPPGRLVRRRLARPQRLPLPPRHEPEAWLGARGPIKSMQGPYRTSGGWWVRTVERDYYFVETHQGEILWVFYDRARRGWYLHGWVD